LRRKDEGANGASARETEPAIRSGGFIEWLEEKASPMELEIALRPSLPDFSASALTDSGQRMLINRRLAALGPVTLYELHQQLSNRGKSVARLTPDEIIEKTWGTIKGIDPVLLREIIEDEDYCGC
jgi:hypothetical protein